MKQRFFKAILFSIILVVNCYAQPHWQKIKTPTDFNLLKVFYLDSLHCWVAGDSGVILFSGDQGINWDLQNSGVSNYINDLFFLNESLGWAVAFELEGFNIRSKIISTTNGGQSWQVDNYKDLDIILTTIFFHDSSNGWVAGEPFELSSTKDGGRNWNPANIDTGSFAFFNINKIKFSTPQYGFAVGGIVDAAGVVWRTDNYGQLWKAYGIAPDKFDDFLFLDSINALTLSADLERLYPIGVLKFNIERNFWDYSELTLYGNVTSLARRKENEIWGTLRCDTNFVVSFDTANSWQFFPTGDSLCINAIFFADSLRGIAVGEGGNIFRYIPDSPVSAENNEPPIPEKFSLKQNFPNPFNPSTIISWESPVSGLQTITIYDILGNEVAIIVNEYKSAGAYNVEFTIDNLKLGSGIYFYQLRVKDFVETKKMILIK